MPPQPASSGVTDPGRSFSCDQAAARPTNCDRCASRAASPRTRRARCSPSSARRACSAPRAVESGVPSFLRNSGKGWLTAEYGMLPRATHTRSAREAARGKQGGRTHEIQRLIGRSLRACIDLGAIGERTITIDCDVLQATAARARPRSRRLRRARGRDRHADRAQGDRLEPAARPDRRGLRRHRRRHAGPRPRVLRGRGCRDGHERRHELGRRLHRVQGTAEGHAFRREELDAMLNLAVLGTSRLFGLQLEARQG